MSTTASIIVAEDSATQREQLCAILGKLSCKLTAASNGREALEAAHDSPPDILITDVVMPEMSGYELCREVKAQAHFVQTAVILLTSLSDPIDVIRGLACGADNFIIKPYDEQYLLARVAQILNNRGSHYHEPDRTPVEVDFAGQRFMIKSGRRQILNLLLTTYETAVQRNLELERAQRQLRRLTESLEDQVKQRTARLEAEVEERSRAEVALQEQTEVLQSVLLSMSDALLVSDAEGLFVLLNPAARRLFAIADDEPLPPDCPFGETAFHADRVTPYPTEQLPIRRALRGEECPAVELWLRRSSGDGVFVSATASPIRDRIGSIRGGVVVIRDITASKQMELQLLRSQRMDSVGALAGGVAHDLNNVLAPIVMASELLLMDAVGKKAKHLQTIHKSASRGAELVRQLLTFARGCDEEGRVPLPIYQVIRELVQVVRDTFPRSVEIRSKLDQDLWTVIGDSTQIDQVLLNLCVNARDAMPRGGVITVSAKNCRLDELEVCPHNGAKPGPHVLVSVSDTGSGIPQAILERMYEPFFTTKERGKGTGLGLSTVLGIVRSHGGFIEVQTQPGHGTTFHVYFPAEPDELHPQASENVENIPLGNGELILIVDDEEAIRQTLGSALEHYGYRVLVAEDGAAATALLARSLNEVVLAIVDMTMPLMDGITTLRVLRKLDPELKAILTSGIKEPLEEEALVGSSVAAVLRKPYKTGTLIRAVRACLPGSE